jgi:hypothetical protein
MTKIIRGFGNDGAILNGLVILALLLPISAYAEENQPTIAPNYSLWGTHGKAEIADTQPVEVGVKFRTDVDGNVNAVRFYRSVPNSSGYKVNIWSAEGELLGTGKAIEGTGPTPGWQAVQIYPPVALKAGQTYVASYYASKGQYYVSENYFPETGMKNGPLRALGSEEEGGNGVYVYGEGGGFPTQSYKSGNYWVDVSFTPANAP